METFSNRLKQHRGLLRWGQADLSKKLHICRRTICHWECGDYIPDRATVGTVATVLGLNQTDRAELFVSAGYWPDNVEDWRLYEMMQRILKRAS